MVKANPDLSIILVCWKSRHFIERCLKSIYQESDDISFEIILVNDESGDGTPEFVETHYPQVHLIRNQERVGIGVARNIGLSNARGRYLLIFDVDTETLDHAFSKMIQFADARPEIGIVGCKLIYPTGELQYTCRKFSGPISFLFRRTRLSQWFPDSPFLQQYLLSNWDHASEREVDYVAGACMLIRREAFEQVGYMAAYFHGPEDQEYCYRVNRAGWKIVYYPGAIIIHEDQQVSAKGSFLNRNLRIQIREGLDFLLQRTLDKMLNRSIKNRPFLRKI